jgi:hypothetical protein
MAFFIFSSVIVSAEQIMNVTATASQDVIDDYYRFLANRDPLKITYYGGAYSRRDVVELVLFQQALAVGGLNCKVHFFSTPSYQRSLIELRQGFLMATAEPVWGRDVKGQSQLWMSPSLVQPGEFVAGLYTTKEKAERFKNLSLKELKNLKIVTNKVWRSDFESLVNAGFVNILETTQWDLMVRMVKYGRADMLLSAFRPTKDMSLTDQDVTLYPVPGYKIVLKGQRVWAVNKNLPNSEKVIRALAAGTRELVKNKTVSRAYQESGFFNSKVEDWTVLSGEAKN